MRRMRRDLARPLAPPAWPEGISVGPFRTADAPAIHALLELGYRQGYGTVADQETWHDALVSDDEFAADLCFVAKDGAGRVVGIAQCWTVGFVKDLVVHPEWRRRGLGLALLHAAFAAFAARGKTHVDLRVDADNEAAIALYDKAGMREVP